MAPADRQRIWAIAATIILEGDRSNMEIGAEVVRRGLEAFPDAERPKLIAGVTNLRQVLGGVLEELGGATALERDVPPAPALGMPSPLAERPWSDLSNDEQRRAFELLRFELQLCRSKLGRPSADASMCTDAELVASALRELETLLR